MSLKFLLSLLLMLCMVTALHAQKAPCYQAVSEPLSGVVTGANRSISLPLTFTLDKKVYKAGVKINADAGADYIFGRPWDYPFNAVITFQLQALTAANVVVPGVFNNSSYTITLTNDKPEGSFVKDFNSLAGINGTFPFTQFKVTISSVSVTSSGSTPSSVLSQISSKLRLFIGYDIQYGFDLSSASAPSTLTMSSQDISGTREVQFKWDNGNQEFCNYQFQLLRLYNTSSATTVNEKNITATVDWSQALTIQTENPATNLKLTVAEGQGYYIWRVRPIGTYYPGGIANPLNLKENLWSTAPASGASLLLNAGSLASYPTAFFLTDPDDNINRIYSRTFTEGNKVSETTTYANSLMQVKQTQSYLPSLDTTLVVEHVLDMSGRPALTTIPAPQDSSMYLGFKPQFFQTEDAQLYTGKNYDVDSNYNNPRRAKQSGGAYQYYSPSNANDPNVADAQGYPYQRTQYYNDGTDRVKQQSGVGKQQMIGDGNSSNAKGEGKTVRTYYGTATEEELIQLFGDEAPSSENVFKTINIDQNNTATVTLTNKEGKVIATSLSFQDQDNDGVFEPLEGEGTKATLNTVSDTVTINTRTPAGFVSSKRLAVLQTTPMDISYQISCDTLNFPCANGEVDCGYHLKIQLFNLDSNTVHELYDNDLKNVSCASVEGKEGKYKTVTLDPVTLYPGNYIIQKNLTIGSVTVAITQAQDKINLQTSPITGLIKGWLDGVKCPPQLDTFFVHLRKLAKSFHDGRATTDYSFPLEFVTLYNANPSAFQLTVTPSTGIPQQATLTTPCCGSMHIPINWTPPFNCPGTPRLVDKNSNGILDVHPYNPYASPDSLDQPEEFFPDFEGYARVFLQECWDSTEFYGTYMEGWKPGQFNLMVYHMLTDQYNCTNNYPNKDTSTVKKQIDSLMNQTKTIYNSCGEAIGTYDEAGVSNGCGDPVTVNIYSVPTLVPACPQYTCDELFNCWAAQLSAYRAKRCLLIDYGSEDNNVGNKSDKQKGGAFNDNFNDNFKAGGLLGKWIAKKAAGDRMRDLQADGSGTVHPNYERHLVQDFLECTGYRFAKVLTPYDRNPLTADQGSGIDYTVGSSNDNVLNDIDDSKKTNGDYYYMPFSNWTPGKTTSTPTPAEVNTRKYKGYFPFIKNPIYAFKYFEYPYEGDDSYQDVEAMTCYSDPNDCYKTFDPTGNTPAVRIPCCVTINSDGSYNTSGCFKDYNYPNIDSLVLDPDPSHPTFGIIVDGSGDRYKLTVPNFCQIGRYSCTYIKDMWSCGQRAGFYQALKSYQVPPAGFNDLDVSSDCSSINILQNWYLNPESDVNGLPDTLSSGQVSALIAAPGSSYTLDDFSQLKFKNVSGDSVLQLSVAEFEMVRMNESGYRACEQRRPAIVEQLKELLFNKCYVIGPCKSDADYVADNVIPEDDFNAMVDAVIAQCKGQCAISSYRCAPLDSCRKFKTAKTFLGNNITDDNILTYGVAGSSADEPYCSLVSGRDYYNCSGGADSSLSYCQYTRYKEAIGWFIELDLPSACSGKEYTRTFSCDPGNDTCVPKNSYEKTGDPQSLPTVTTSAVPVNVVVEE